MPMREFDRRDSYIATTAFSKFVTVPATGQTMLVCTSCVGTKCCICCTSDPYFDSRYTFGLILDVVTNSTKYLPVMSSLQKTCMRWIWRLMDSIPTDRGPTDSCASLEADCLAEASGVQRPASA